MDGNLVRQFPIEIGIEHIDGKKWIQFYKFEGIAKLKHWKEVAKFGGWCENQIPILEGEEEWEEGDIYFPSNSKELFILNQRLILN